MSLEQLAIFGIVVFAIMALATSFNMVRSVKRSIGRPKLQRVRRLVGGRESARMVAKSVVQGIAQKHPLEVNKTKKEGQLTPELEKVLDEARAYFLGRVESRHRALFGEAVDQIILGRSKEG